MLSTLQQVVRSTDAAIAQVYLGLRPERDALVTFLFHSLFRDEVEFARNDLDPLDYTTVDRFRQVIEYYLAHGYQFVSPDDLLRGLPPRGKFALLTFDDGYFNNTRALPVLEEFGVPALFFIATDYVQKGRCFWWDVLHRERLARGASIGSAYHEGVGLKHLRTAEIEARLAGEFGAGAFRPRGDLDRPFTPDELRDFARHRHVHLGNHTAGHAILTNYSPDEVRDQVRSAQDALHEMTGITPKAIAYPNGGHNESVLRICADLGLRLGFTTEPRKTPLCRVAPAASARCPSPAPIRRPPALLRLGRFGTHGQSPILAQCRTCRSDLRLYPAFRRVYTRLLRGDRW